MKLRPGCNWKLVYADYLTTPHWRQKRQETWDYFGGTCRECGSRKPPLECHHTNYECLFEEIVGQDVVLLCGTCHELAHGHDWKIAMGDPTYLVRKGIISVYEPDK